MNIRQIMKILWMYSRKSPAVLKKWKTVWIPCEEPKERRLFIQIDRLSFQYGAFQVIHDFSMTLEEGERIWIKGPNGCGKSTLLKLINRELDTESISVAEDLAITFSYQEPLWQEGFALEKYKDKKQYHRFLTFCNCLDISDNTLDRPIDTYSSGEKRKVDIARALSEENTILLLDEPLNYMDVYFREQLERAILASQPTLIFVEHDEHFGSHVATRTIELPSSPN